jgi:hypothetical protein
MSKVKVVKADVVAAVKEAAKTTPFESREAILFKAIIAPVSTAINFHGESGARVLLEVGDEYLEAIHSLIKARTRELDVTIVPGDALTEEGDED